MTPIVLALLLGASGQATGQMSPTSDVSQNRVKATGSTTPRALKDRASDVVNVKDFGAKGDGTTDDTAALRAAIASAWTGANAGAKVFVPPGTYITDRLTLHTGQTLWGSNWQGSVWTAGYHGSGTGAGAGSGIGASILKSRTGDTVVQLGYLATDPGNAYEKNIEVAYIDVQGAGSTVGTSAGILSNGPGGGHSHLHVHHVAVTDFGGPGVRLAGEWTTLLEFVSSDNNGGHAFDIQGGNTTGLDHCYAHRVANGMVGFRIRGSAVLTSCNGIDQGSGALVRWGEFGQTVADDGMDSQSLVTLINCNVEDFTDIGIRVKGPESYLTVIGGAFGVAANTTAKALLFEANTASGSVILAPRFYLKSGSAWSNGQAIHVNAAPAPIVFGGTASVPTRFYKDDAAGTGPIPQIFHDRGNDALGLGQTITPEPAFAEKRYTGVVYSSSMTFSSLLGTLYIITATNGTAFTINNPTAASSNLRITIQIRNNSGGALGTLTWGSAFKLGAWTQPANQTSRSITFVYNNGTSSWEEVSRTAADVPF
jgi:hypothetical protein